MLVPPLVLLELRLTILLPVNNLPHYHGAHWSALFRNMMKAYLPEEKVFSYLNFWVNPVESGILSYEAGETVHVGITFPSKHVDAVNNMLQNFNFFDTAQGHFQPGKTIFLNEVFCRISKTLWDYKNMAHLDYGVIEQEVRTLEELESFTLLLYTPMRVKRPKDLKKQGHRYFDEEFFLDEHNIKTASNCLVSGIKSRNNTVCGLTCDNHNLGTDNPITDIQVENGTITWLDLFYGTNPSKTIGGVVGKIVFRGKLSYEEAFWFVLGQYTGAGKNPVFGLGFYVIPELDNARRVASLTRGTTLLERAFSTPSLALSLSRLPNSSPGLDSITIEDVRMAGTPYLEDLKANVLQGNYEQGPLKKYRLPKEDGNWREIQVQNVCDRLVHKAAADCLSPVIDGLLSYSSYAFRRGLNRKGAASALKNAISEGYKTGIKADVFSFFDSINIGKLTDMLESLLPFEPLVHNIRRWFKTLASFGIKGLPQGSPISPVLSNLYLNRFDKDMAKEDFRLVRYADDFVILTKEGIGMSDIIDKIGKSLSRLDLRLKEEKTVEVRKGIPISFLGYLICEDGIAEPDKQEATKNNGDEWAPVFKDQWHSGRPVYLTTLCRGAYSSGADLVIKHDNDSTENIPWNRINRIVIVGRSQFSGGVVYRAVKEEIPVTFIDLFGKARGSLHPEFHEMPEIMTIQEKYSKDPDFILSFAIEIVSAKINNSAVLLRRNLVDTSGMKEMESSAKNSKTLETLRGCEGNAAKFYFSQFAGLVEPFEFAGRVYRPPEGPVNILLSLGYTLLYNRIATVLRDKGFNARLGFYHKGRGMHNALASDLLEELRHIVERVVLSLIHLGEIKQEDFVQSKKHGKPYTRLEGEGFRKYIRRFEKTMSSKASYHGGEKISYNTYLDEMADSLKRSLKLGIPYKALRIE